MGYIAQIFISTIKDDLLTHKKIFTLTQLLELFSEFLPFDGNEIDTSHRLQQKLERYFGDLITIQPQQGQDIQTWYRLLTRRKNHLA
jgi:hypothetical protein